jgi:hypothetical protein
MDADEAREQRQLQLMLDRLVDLERGDLGIGQAIADLRGLLGALALTPEPWRERFQSDWIDLETEYASALSKQEPPPDSSNPAVQQATQNMMGLVQERLRLYR